MNLQFNKLAILMILLISFPLSGCGSEIEPTPPTITIEPTPSPPPVVEDPPTPEELQAIELATLLARMTLEEKVGQIFIITPDDLPVVGHEEELTFEEEFHQSLLHYPVGGFILFSDDISSPEQVIEVTDRMKASGEITPFISIDEEGGTVARLANHKAFDLPTYRNMQTVGNSGDTDQAYEVGLVIGSYLVEHGFNLDFAPVADVNTNPNNPVIGGRAFSSDPDLAAEMVVAAIGGFQESGIMTCIKHFPGHGDTKADTHYGTAISEQTWEEMLECEMLPFVEGISAGVDMVMVSHIITVNVTTDQLPSTLSHDMITGKLRNELGYEGVIITDAMNMGAIVNEFSSSEAAVTSFLAGNDILLMIEDFVEGFDGIMSALEDGTITETRLDESVMRILSLKQQYGLLG
ncbi:MAG: glycoside hydrolase family 3 protein [Eubacteriales bacterium]